MVLFIRQNSLDFTDQGLLLAGCSEISRHRGITGWAIIPTIESLIQNEGREEKDNFAPY